jgi:hypothetical protein
VRRDQLPLALAGHRLESKPRDRPGAPSAISLKVRQPRMTMLRRMMMDQRSASSSDARAIGQYWP